MIDLIENCNLCGKKVSTDSRIIAEGFFDHYGVQIKIHTMMCNNCKHIFQYEQFNDKTLSFLYESDTQNNSFDDRRDVRVYLKNLKKRQQFLLDTINSLSFSNEKKLNILDVGGGSGEISECLVERGSVYLADVSANKPINAQMIKIPKMFSEVNLDVKFDVIIMNHVLEHVFSPMSFLMKANTLLTDRGVIIIEVPFELYTPFFKRIGDWKHVVYFSSMSLRNFLKKSGFNPIFVKLTTGYYETRSLPVIRAVARKAECPSKGVIYKSGYLSLLLDVFNLKALAPYVLSKIVKLVK
jgi:2-polyprenyl-3-methyl-5-hydroxy-6-metoxy-1,4-benzoquinol methylase